ncbi:D-Ala-D-Ala carboxypeptidase family metallohydrolase [Stenotrophomonas maltophilia]
MANFYEAFAQGQANGLERQKAITQRNQLAELQAIAPQVMAGDLDATSRAYALNPQTAQAYQAEGNRQNQQLVGLAKTLKQYADNPQMQAGVYRSALPYLKRNFGAEIPDQFDAATVMPIVDQVLSVANNTPNFNGQTPTDVRSFQMMTQGLSPEDVERARRINLGLAGRESSAAIGYQKVKGPDGVERLVAVDPRQIGAQVVGDGMGYGSFSQPAPMAGGGNHFAAFSQLATEFPSVTMTSGVRSAERNAQVGGQPNSQHLNGTAADYAVPANQKPAFISRARQLGYQAIDEGDHIHLQVPRGAGGGANLFAGRRPEDEAAAVEAAKLGTQQQFLPQELAMRTQAAIQQAGGSAQAKGEAEARLEAVQNLPRVMQESTNAINLIDKALSHPGLATAVGASGRTDPRNYIPGTDATDFRVLLDQIKGGTFLQAFQSLKGGGAITEVEGTKAEQAIARLNRDQSEAAFKQSLQDLRDVAQAAITRAQTKAQAAGAPAPIQPQGAPRQIQSAAEYNALPSGALFIAPDGTQRRKR